MSRLLTVPEVGKRLGCPHWAVRILFTRGKLPEPARAGLVRLIPESDLPKIEAALRAAGYLRTDGKIIPEPIEEGAAC